MKSYRIKEKVLAILFVLCMVLTIIPADVNASTTGNTKSISSEVEEPILYQTRNDNDVRFISYVDDYKLYKSVEFVLTIDGEDTDPLECYIAYEALYANGELYTAEQIYGASGYFVTYTVEDYIRYFPGEEVTITVTYYAKDGSNYSVQRTTVIGARENASGVLNFANAYDWTTNSYLNNFNVYASTSSTATPLSLCGQSTGFFAWQNGIVLELDTLTNKWEVVLVDWAGDGVNDAESQTLGSNRMIIIFHNEVATNQEESYNFFKTYMVVGAQFVLNGDFAAIQAVSGTIIGVSLSLYPIEDETTNPPSGSEGDGEEDDGEDPVVGNVSSTITTYNSTGSCTASSGDTDGLSAVLYAPSNATGISTYLNLGAVHTTLYTAPTSLALQNMGSGIASDKDIDNAYLYLCMNSTNWSGDYGVIKRLGDADWEIVTNDYYYSSWRWNAYSYPETSGVTVSYDENYLYWKHNVMDGRTALYIKNSKDVSDLQMNMIISGSTLTFSIRIGGVEVFSVSDTATFSNIKLGRAASVTNSNTTSYGSSNYLYQIASSATGKTPTEVTNVQFYDSYYYTSTGYGKLTIDAGTLWLYPNKSSNAGYTSNKNGDPIVTCQEVYLEDGRIMDIINIQNY